MFKKGDIVYCVKNMYKIYDSVTLISFLCLNVPYVIRKRIYSPLDNFGVKYSLENVGYNYYEECDFISERDYILKIRKDKIKKIKECLKKVI